MAKKAHVLKALELFSRELSGKQNVVGMGVVPVEGMTGPELALGVYVSKKLPESVLKESQCLPKTVAVPMKSGSVEVPVRVIEQGPVQLEHAERL